MSFDLEELTDCIGAHGPLVRVVVASVAGSAPREAGAAMLVWGTGQQGTIGGGALEWQAAADARAMLVSGEAARLTRVPLGPNLGQCCGGAVTLGFERFDAGLIAALPDGPLFARALGPAAAMPMAVTRLLKQARQAGSVASTTLISGWLVEPYAVRSRRLWVWGAGHVGRAIVQALAPLPDFAITWVDTSADRFPGAIPAGVTQLVAADPGLLAGHAPQDAEHLVLTFSHALDLDLCHRLLGRGFASLGLIGSATKWARFRSRLRALSHDPQSIARIICPIGEPALGKHPQAIALGVAAALLRERRAAKRTEMRAG